MLEKLIKHIKQSNRRVSLLLAVFALILGLSGCAGEPGEIYRDIAESAMDYLLEEAAEEITEGTAQVGAEISEVFPVSSEAAETDQEWLDPDGTYTTAEDVSLYLYLYEELPQNFMTKKEAKALGWTGGSLEEIVPGMCIGGDYFGNYEGLLPQEEGRDYYECDIDTLGAESRGAKRIVYSDDGLIYYTEDHYESFELLYGEE